MGYYKCTCCSCDVAVINCNTQYPRDELCDGCVSREYWALREEVTRYRDDAEFQRELQEGWKAKYEAARDEIAVHRARLDAMGSTMHLHLDALSGGLPILWANEWRVLNNWLAKAREILKVRE